MTKIYISPSDQTANRYAWGDTDEAAQCGRMAKALAQALTRCGMAAKIDPDLEMEERVASSNAWGAALHLCIHTNASNGTVRGTRLFSYDTAGAGYRACQAVMARLAPITPGSSDQITPRPELYEVRHAAAPTVYVEVGFHDHPEEAMWLVTHTREIGEAICRGLCDYYGVAYAAPVYHTLEEVPAYARGTIEKLLTRDLLLGTPQGLELTTEMIRLLVINDRAGLYG